LFHHAFCILCPAGRRDARPHGHRAATLRFSSALAACSVDRACATSHARHARPLCAPTSATRVPPQGPCSSGTFTLLRRWRRRASLRSPSCGTMPSSPLAGATTPHPNPKANPNTARTAHTAPSPRSHCAPNAPPRCALPHCAPPRVLARSLLPFVFTEAEKISELYAEGRGHELWGYTVAGSTMALLYNLIVFVLVSMPQTNHTAPPTALSPHTARLALFGRCARSRRSDTWPSPSSTRSS
jgi:hypothetical protein